LCNEGYTSVVFQPSYEVNPVDLMP
jgi:hypothetical protein